MGELVDPACPNCGTKAGEHEDNECFGRMLANAAGWDMSEGEGGIVRVPWVDDGWLGFDELVFWQVAGPLLEEMKGDVFNSTGEDGIECWTCDAVKKTAKMVIIEPIEAESPTLAICRAWLIWKANYETETT